MNPPYPSILSHRGICLLSSLLFFAAGCGTDAPEIANSAPQSSNGTNGTNGVAVQKTVAGPAATNDAAIPKTPPTNPSSEIKAVATGSAGNNRAPETEARSDGSPSPERIVENLKKATVYIKLSAGGRVISTGTGYVIRRNGSGQVLIATNRHVVSVDLDTIPEGMLPDNAKIQIETVFRSGQPEEQSVRASLIAMDPSMQIENDIAFLAAKDVKFPPEPIDLTKTAEPNEGQSYIGGGFPLGGMINKIIRSEASPSITITKGSVSALRRDDDFKVVKLIQLDGSLQPGNSGGPIVDSTTGRLIGMAVAKANADTIGFLIPAARIRQALDGTVGHLKYHVKATNDNSADLLIQADLFDPERRMGDLKVHYSPAEKLNGFGPKPDGTWNALPGAASESMQRDSQRNAAQAQVIVRLSGRMPGNRKLFVQTSHQDISGNTVFHEPQAVEVPEKPGPILPKDALPKLIEQLYAKSMKRLGKMVDPDQDCLLSKENEERSVKITVPPKPHSLAVELIKSRKPLNNAPMSLAEVKGDFVALVEVKGDMNPGTEPVKLPSGVTFRTPTGKAMVKLPFTFQGAGLVLYQDPLNHMRVEKSSFSENGSPILESKVLIEVVKNGKQAMRPVYLKVPEEDMMIGILRRKGRVSCLVIVKNTLGLESKELALDFDDKIKIGLSATNISQKPLEAEFSNFVILDDQNKIEEMFGK